MGIPVASRRPSSATWSRRLAEPGWLLLPLRGFLGVTFAYAGLQKLANPAFLDPRSPVSIASQMSALQHSSPIGPLVAASAHAPVAVGLLIALAELAVGVGTLLGFCARVAAAGGALLALTFFLTVSWTTTPYYYGADIVFVFAWLTMLGFGDQGVLSLRSWLDARARAGLRPGSDELLPSDRDGLGRRAVLRTGAAAAVVAGATAVLAGATAGIGRLLNGTRSQPPAAALGPAALSAQAAPSRSTPTASASSPSSPPGSSSSSSPGSSPASGGHGAAPGTLIGSTTELPVGQAGMFTDPASGNPAWLVHPSGTRFVAFDAICTHAGCTVRYNRASVQFDCPCHGGVYDAVTGKVLQGPPPRPLRRIPVYVVGTQLRVD